MSARTGVVYDYEALAKKFGIWDFPRLQWTRCGSGPADHEATDLNGTRWRVYRDTTRSSRWYAERDEQPVTTTGALRTAWWRYGSSAIRSIETRAHLEYLARKDSLDEQYDALVMSDPSGRS